MPKDKKPTSRKGVPLLLPMLPKLRAKTARYDPGGHGPRKGVRGGKIRGGRPPRFPGRTGGR